MPKRILCTYRDNDGRCRRTGYGQPPLCEEHAVDDDYEPIQDPRELVEAILENPAIKSGIGKANSILDKFSSILDNISNVTNRIPKIEPKPQIDPKKMQELRARKVLGFSPSEPLTEDLLKSKKRDLAKKYHPDVIGGDGSQMAVVNRAIDILSESIKIQ